MYTEKNPVDKELQPDAKPSHTSPYPVSLEQKAVFNKEFE